MLLLLLPAALPQPYYAPSAPPAPPYEALYPPQPLATLPDTPTLADAQPAKPPSDIAAAIASLVFNAQRPPVMYSEHEVWHILSKLLYRDIHAATTEGTGDFIKTGLIRLAGKKGRLKALLIEDLHSKQAGGQLNNVNIIFNLPKHVLLNYADQNQNTNGSMRNVGDLIRYIEAYKQLL